MVNENTRMYIPEENHQGKAGPAARPRPQRGLQTSRPDSGSPGAGPCGVARGASASPEPRDRARTPRDRAENSRPSPSRAGFFGACVSYEIPGEGEKLPKCLLLPRFSTFAWKAQLPGPLRVGKGAPPSSSPAGRGPSPRSGRGWERARAPRTRPAPRPGRRPVSHLLLGAAALGSAHGGGGGTRMQMRVSAPRSSLPRLTYTHPPLQCR